MIPQIEPVYGSEEINALTTYMESGGWLTEFKRTEEFEQRIAETLKVKYASVVNNGTISLTIALLALGIKPGDEVLVPNLTMIATPSACRLIGVNPILVDVSSEDLCMNLPMCCSLPAQPYLQETALLSLSILCPQP
jgi:perosamine synthetase